MLNYQLNEIENAKLKKDEEEELDNKQKIIQNSEKIARTLNEIELSIGENTIDLISNAIKQIEKIENIDSKYEQCTNSLKSVYYEIQEISRDVSNFRENIYFDENEQKEIEKRLDSIYDLKRKYGNSINEILDYKNEVEEEIYRIENMEEHTNNLKQQQNRVKEKLEEIGMKIHNLRELYSNKLANEINNNLQELEMKNAKINIHIDLQEDFLENGKDKVEFFISTNVGEDEKELIKIASGGEMSRIMLAIKTVIANSDKIPVLIFDEIDTGISGKASNKVAEKLSKIAKNHQVICISHLPSIAAIADYNYFINKSIENERTRTTIKMLEEKEILKEIARISSGEINEASLNYAKELRCKKKAS